MLSESRVFKAAFVFLLSAPSIVAAERSGTGRTVSFPICCGSGVSSESMEDAMSKAASECARLCRCYVALNGCSSFGASNFEYSTLGSSPGPFIAAASCTCTLSNCDGYMSLREEDEVEDPICASVRIPGAMNLSH